MGVCHLLVFARQFCFVELSIVYNGKLGTSPTFPPAKNMFHSTLNLGTVVINQIKLKRFHGLLVT